MRSIITSIIILGLYGVVVGTASRAVTGTFFQPVKVLVDLSHADQRPSLEGPWEIRPDARFPGVMAARDRGQPVHLTVTLPTAQTYQGRWKFRFERMDQVIDVQVNGAVIATARPSKIGKAQKVAIVIPARVVVAGVNRITFVNHGTPGGTEYELIRLQNYQTALVKKHLYLLPRAAGDTAPQPSSPRAPVPIALVAVAVVGVVSAGAAWGMRRVAGQTWRDALLGERMACAPLLVLAVLAVMPYIAPYRITCTAPLFWRLIGIILMVGHVPLLLGWLLQMTIRKVASLDPAGGVEFLSGALGQGQRLSKTGAVLVTSGFKQGWSLSKTGAVLVTSGFKQGWRLSKTGVKWSLTGCWVGMRLAAFGFRECWRWFLRQQHPKGYAKIFCYVAAAALLSHWVFHWERFAEISGYVAGAALVIAVIWESLLSLNEED